MKMPYGKFRGHVIELLPSAYLKWLAENIGESTKERAKICQEADKEWQFREKNGCHVNS